VKAENDGTSKGTKSSRENAENVTVIVSGPNEKKMLVVSCRKER